MIQKQFSKVFSIQSLNNFVKTHFLEYSGLIWLLDRIRFYNVKGARFKNAITNSKYRSNLMKANEVCKDMFKILIS